ncbi:MAG: hypothetical protein CLLPBCKN_006375 [Chroococcidiopsis cubana SAG 39.79]|uniref:hypothetical protein n=1 Tax=Chroococcidiopsis cubana TaxID=171392 RepID=UPI000F8D38C1|nr:hypothetical protein [Chroococcidiopsis cubana]MDZ4876940.1 hypothetical protein [Chroococcidiopsis cubana SAG 39.79]
MRTLEVFSIETRQPRLDRSTDNIPGRGDSPDLSLLLASHTQALAVIFVAVILLVLRKVIKGKNRFSQNYRLREVNEIPCRKCRFFCQSNYLQCAVNPSKVLTLAALNCPDYFPK